MLVKTKNGYEVLSENGDKKLSKSNLSKSKALKRLREIEFYKNK